MKIERKISTSTITSIKTTIPRTLSVPATLEYIFCVIPATIDAKIKREIPLDTPFSVISSPSHINQIAPTVMTNADKITVGNDVAIIFPPSI